VTDTARLGRGVGEREGKCSGIIKSLGGPPTVSCLCWRGRRSKQRWTGRINNLISSASTSTSYSFSVADRWLALDQARFSSLSTSAPWLACLNTVCLLSASTPQSQSSFPSIAFETKCQGQQGSKTHLCHHSSFVPPRHLLPRPRHTTAGFLSSKLDSPSIQPSTAGLPVSLVAKTANPTYRHSFNLFQRQSSVDCFVGNETGRFSDLKVILSTPLIVRFKYAGATWQQPFLDSDLSNPPRQSTLPFKYHANEYLKMSRSYDPNTPVTRLSVSASTKLNEIVAAQGPPC
jgi:hypothetical protein